MTAQDAATRWTRLKHVFKYASRLAHPTSYASRSVMIYDSSFLKSAMALTVLEAFALLDDVLKHHYHVQGRTLYARLQEAEKTISFVHWQQVDDSRNSLRNKLGHGEAYELNADVFDFERICSAALHLIGQELAHWGLIDASEATIDGA